MLQINQKVILSPPPTALALSTVTEKIQEWNCNRIFLATEDKTIIRDFKNAFDSEFGDFCKIFDRKYVDYKTGQRLSNVRINRENDYYLQGKDYLTQMLLLTMCNSFITAKTSGSAGVMTLAENFENTFVFDLGLYP